MEITESIVVQLIVVGLLATLLFVFAYSLPQKIAATGLVLLIPFQPVETRVGTANVLLTFVLFLAMIMREKDIRLPMLPQVLIVLFVFLVSMGLAHPGTWTEHGLYMVYLVSAFLVLWITYDLAMRFSSFDRIFQVFLATNVLLIIYCLIQLAAGPDQKVKVFGMDEFAFFHLRSDYRLTGPFGTPGILAEYVVIMVFVALQQLMVTDSRNYRRFLVVLTVFNLFLLVATGNRGGFLTLIGAGIMYLWMSRHLLGAVRTLTVAITGVLLFSVSAAIAVNYTEFDRLFERLVETEVEEGIPDTRAVVWPMAWNEIKNRPFFGHGPRLRFVEDEEGRTKKGHVFIYYPHNLYLFLLFTVGSVGLIAMLALMVTPMYRCWRTARKVANDPVALSYANTGIVIMVVIFVDQIKVEFLRFLWVDYWHFVFALMGALIAYCDRVETKLRASNSLATGAGMSTKAQASHSPAYSSALKHDRYDTQSDARL
jgi:O-antigen ligase